jgi:hypothetical protein
MTKGDDWAVGQKGMKASLSVFAQKFHYEKIFDGKEGHPDNVLKGQI